MKFVGGDAQMPAITFSGSTRSGHGERSRSQLLLKLAGAENVLILVVNASAVNVLAVNGALHALYSVKKYLIHSIECPKVSERLYTA